MNIEKANKIEKMIDEAWNKHIEKVKEKISDKIKVSKRPKQGTKLEDFFGDKS